jgi:hypothetical protein
MIRTSWILASAFVALGVAPALADETAPAPATAPTEQLTAPKGKLVINAFFELNLSKDAVGKPISISPDVWYGITDDLTLGLVHSSVGATGLLGGVGDALCLRGKMDGCADGVYSGVGLDVRYRLKAPLSLDAGLYATDFDPFSLALKIGASGRWKFGKLALEVQPSIFFGLTERDTNKELLVIPVTAAFEVATSFELALQVGLATPFDGAGDNFKIPVSLGARYQVNGHLGVGLVFSLPAVAGGDMVESTGFDARTITLGGTYAL